MKTKTKKKIKKLKKTCKALQTRLDELQPKPPTVTFSKQDGNL